MDRRILSQLADIAAWKLGLEQLCFAGPIGSEDQRLPVRQKGTLQEVSWMVDRRMVRHLMNRRAGDGILKIRSFRWGYLAFAHASDPQVFVPPRHEGLHLAIGHGAFQHPESAIGMYPAQAS